MWCLLPGELCKLKEADQKLLIPLSKSTTLSSVVLVPSSPVKWLICYICHYPISSVWLGETLSSDPTQPRVSASCWTCIFKTKVETKSEKNAAVPRSDTEYYLCLHRQTNPTTQSLLKGNWRRAQSVFLAKLILPWASQYSEPSSDRGLDSGSTFMECPKKNLPFWKKNCSSIAGSISK